MARPVKAKHDRDFERMTSEKTLDRVTSDLSASLNFQQPFLDKFIEYYQLYRAYVDPANIVAGRSHLFIPYAFHIIETEVPRIVNALVNTRPFVQTQPLGVPAEDREIRAKKMNYLLDYQFQQKIRFVPIMVDVAKATKLYGTAITRQGWMYEKKEMPVRRPARFAGLDAGFKEKAYEERVIHDEPSVRVVPLWDFFFDPSATSIDACRYCIEREWMDYSEVLALQESLGVKFAKMPELEEDAKGGSQNISSNPHLDSVGLSGGQGQNNRKSIEVLHYWTSDRYVIVANRRFTLHSDESPYDHGKIPYAKYVMTPIPNEFYGVSEMEMVSDLQEELNVTRNQRIDNVSLILNKMFLIMRSANIDTSQLITRPGGFIEVDEKGDVTEMPFTDVTQSSYNEEARIKADMDIVTGVNDTTRGSEGSRRETATTMNILANAGAERFKTQVTLFAYGGMHDMIQQVIRLNQQFIPEAQQIVIIGKDGTLTSDVVTAEEVLGEWDIVGVGSAIEPAVNTDIQQSNTMALYAQVKDNPQVNQEELLRRIFEVYKFKNINGLVNPTAPPPTPELAPPLPENPMLAQMQSQTNFEAGAPMNMGV